MPIGELCNREVVVIEADAPIGVAVKLMRDFHVGDVVVIEQLGSQRIPVGVLTDRDVVIKILAEDIDPKTASVGRFMSAPLVTAREADDLVEVVGRMRVHGVRRIPVVNEQGGLEGMLAADDVLELLAEQMNGLAGVVGNEQRRERERCPSR